MPSLHQSPTLECNATHGVLIPSTLHQTAYTGVQRHSWTLDTLNTANTNTANTANINTANINTANNANINTANISMPEHAPWRHWRGGIATIVASSHMSFSSRPLLNTSTASHHVSNHCQLQLLPFDAFNIIQLKKQTRHYRAPPRTTPGNMRYRFRKSRPRERLAFMPWLLTATRHSKTNGQPKHRSPNKIKPSRYSVDQEARHTPANTVPWKTQRRQVYTTRI